MRYLTFILLGLGSLIAIVALAVVFLGGFEADTVPPQNVDAESVTITTTQDAEDGTNGTNGTASQSQSDANSDASSDANSDTKTDAPALAASTDAASPQGALAIDLAQVKPDGSAVFAGKASPGAKITIFEGEVRLGETVADENGEWVVILEKRLAPGQHLVSIAMEPADGESGSPDAVLADVVLAVNISEGQDEQPLVAALPQTETQMPRLLQSPDDTQAVANVDTTSKTDTPKTDTPKTDTTVASTATTRDSIVAAPAVMFAVAPNALAWGEDNQLSISGASKGGVRVTVMRDGSNFGEALVQSDGKWMLAGTVDPNASRMMLAMSLFDVSGKLVANYELPVKMRDLAVGLDGSKMVVINQGDALWRIAYRSYGKGVRYVDIVRRNNSSIDNPDLIYPNQIFALPKE